MDTTVIDWYEDGAMLEVYRNENPESRITFNCSLEFAIQYAWQNKKCLYVQTAFQDAGLFIDYSCNNFEDKFKKSLNELLQLEQKNASYNTLCMIQEEKKEGYLQEYLTSLMLLAGTYGIKYPRKFTVSNQIFEIGNEINEMNYDAAETLSNAIYLSVKKHLINELIYGGES